MLRNLPLLAFALLAAPSFVVAQEPPGSKEIEARIQELEKSSVDETSKTQAVKTYREALQALAEAGKARLEAAKHEQATTSAAERQQLVEADIKKLVETKPEVKKPADDSTVQQLQLLLDQAEAARKTAEEEATQLGQEREARAERLKKLPTEIAAAKKRFGDEEQALDASSDPGPDKPLERARHVLLRTRVERARHQQRELEAELASYTARVDLLPKRQELARLRVTRAEELAKAWQAIVSEVREQEAKKSAAETERRLQTAEGPIRDLLTRNKKLADDQALLGSSLKRENESLASRTKELRELRERITAVQRRLRATGLTDAAGLLLRREYRELDPARLRSRLRSRQELVSDTLLKEVSYAELARAFASETKIQAATAGLRRDLTGQDLERAKTLIRELVEKQGTLLRDLERDYGVLVRTLWSLDTTERTLIGITESYHRYLRERILWVRSIPQARLPDLGAAADAGVGLVDASSWATTLSAVLDGLRRSLPGLVLWLLGLAAASLLGLRARARLRSISEKTAKITTDRFSLSLVALFWAVALAAPLPLALLAASWLLGLADPDALALRVSAGLETVALLLIPLLLLRAALVPYSLATKHFRWPAGSVKALRRHLRWLIPILAGAEFVASAVQDRSEWHESLGRLAFIIGAVTMAVALARILTPEGPVLGEYVRKRGGWLRGLRHVWYWLLVGVPAALVVLALLGYYYTAIQVQNRFFATLWFLLAVILVDALLLRWWFIARRRIAVDRARQRAEAARAVEAETKEATEEREFDLDALGGGELDLPAMNAQTRQLIGAGLALTFVLGLWGIWAETLPALRMLNRVQLWPSITIVEDPVRAEIPGLVENAAPTVEKKPATPAAKAPAPALTPAATKLPETSPPAASEKLDNVTLADLGLVLLLLLATVVAVRNLPSLLELTLLQRLPLDAGARYAITTLSRYLLTLVGVLLIFNSLGIGWSQVQWLIAALTFGLAFGLQEIFANFISGLIILVERPVRIGDIVTVSTVSGYVTKIRMRATTITDWNRKELLVPNKEFITGQLVNWTLSDSVTRLQIPVGVAYGSDTTKALALLVRLAEESPVVLKDPRPKAVFLAFGDSTLNLELRVFIATMDHFPRVMNEIHTRIHEEFAKAGLEIAFPQRDLHLRSAGPLVKIFERGKVEGEARE